MENSNKISLILSIIILLVLIFSYFDLKDSITQIGTNVTENEIEVNLLASTNITVIGEGTRIISTSGGGNCSTTSLQIKAEATIVGGAAGNAITAKAKCSLSNWSASTTSTDIGAAAVYSSAVAPAGTGRANCTPSYVSAAQPDSAWTIVCSF